MANRKPVALLRAPQDGDAEALLADLRPADRMEIEALVGPGKEREALTESMRVSTMLWTATVDDEVTCILGVAPVNMLAGQGIAWLLGTPLIDKHRGAFIRLNRIYIPKMLAAFPHLSNIVDARNTKSISWLKHMGFTVHPARPAGPQGLPFHLFTMDA